MSIRDSASFLSGKATRGASNKPIIGSVDYRASQDQITEVKSEKFRDEPRIKIRGSSRNFYRRVTLNVLSEYLKRHLTIARVILGFFVYVFLLWPFFAEMFNPQWDLLHRGVKTQGKVTAFTPEIHGTVRYSFEVHGAVFDGHWRPTDVVAIGDSVPITYLPERPETSTVGDPSVDGLWFFPFALFPGIAILVALTCIRRKFAGD